jgi:hypothetical protein
LKPLSVISLMHVEILLFCRVPTLWFEPPLPRMPPFYGTVRSSINEYNGFSDLFIPHHFPLRLYFFQNQGKCCHQ